MFRTGPARLVAAFVADVVVPVVLVAVMIVLSVSGPIANVPVAAAAEGDGATAPPVTVTDFYPEESNLSDCVGLVERPGCGSEARGGTGQTVVFVLLVIGLGIIFWRVAVGVRRNRHG